MKRNFNLIRELMLYMNNYNCGCMLQNYSQKQIMYHTNLLKQAGYIKDGYFTDEGVRVLHLIDNKVLFDEAMEILKAKGQFYSFDILLMFINGLYAEKMKRPIYKIFKPKKYFNDYKVLDLLRFFYDKDYDKPVLYYLNLNSCHSVKNVCIKNEKICLAIGVKCIKFAWDIDNTFTVKDLLAWLNTIDINTSVYDVFAVDIIFEWHKYFFIHNLDLSKNHVMGITITRSNYFGKTKFCPNMVNSISNFEKKYIAGNNIV